MVQDLRKFMVPVRLGPIFDLFGPGPSYSGIYKIFSVLVRVGPGFPKFSQSWSELVQDYKILLILVRSGSVLGPGPNRSIVDQPVVVRGCVTTILNIIFSIGCNGLVFIHQCEDSRCRK